MERNIPHVLDIFTSSPGARRRVHAVEIDQHVSVHLKEAQLNQKNPGSDSAVSVGSSDEDEEGRNISKYFDYLNDDDDDDGGSARRKKKKKIGKENIKESNNEDKLKKKDEGKNKKNEEDKSRKKEDNDRISRKAEYEKEMKHIERHLSMKKTIRKKMMRDLQQAFVENPGEFQQDPSRMPPEKKSNIDLHNLTLSKKRLSKSEHNFLDMLKDDQSKDKEKKDRKLLKTFDGQKNKGIVKYDSKDEIRDDDSGNGSPSRERSKSKQDLLDIKDHKDDKKISFWKRLTGKGKSKR